MRIFFKINVFFIFLLPALHIQAQEEVPPLLDNEYSFDITTVPCKNYYGNYWRNDHIRVGKITPPSEELLLNIFNNECTEFVCPVKGKLISPYGMRHGRPHTGSDIKLSLGDTVRAAFSGMVRLAKVYSAYGNMVVIRHYNGLETGYGHLSKILVEPNQYVKAGDPIGLGGRTGRATTEHLHFETRFLLEPFDPEILINFSTFQLKTGCLLYSKNRIATTNAPVLASTSMNSEIINITDTTAVFPDIDKEDNVQENVQPAKKITKSPAKHHTVQQGDTLYSIAKRYNTSVDNIKKWNKIGKDNKINIGKKLIIS